MKFMLLLNSHPFEERWPPFYSKWVVPLLGVIYTLIRKQRHKSCKRIIMSNGNLLQIEMGAVFLLSSRKNFIGPLKCLVLPTTG